MPWNSAAHNTGSRAATVQPMVSQNGSFGHILLEGLLGLKTPQNQIDVLMCCQMTACVLKRDRASWC